MAGKVSALPRFAPVEEMRVALLIKRQRANVDRARQAIATAEEHLKNQETILGALLEKYPGYDEAGFFR